MVYPPNKEPLPINIPEHPIIYTEELNGYVTDTSHLPVKGLTYIPNFITDEEHDQLMKTIYSHPFTKLIHRNQQFYGQVYYHTTHDIKELQPELNDDGTPKLEERTKTVPIPMEELAFITKKLKDKGFFVDKEPDQVLVNEYVGKCGIASHFDNDEAFGDTICTISLGQGIWIQLSTEQGSFKVYVDKNSLFCMQEDARYKYKHGISKTATWVRVPGGQVVKRTNDFIRVSLTVRNLLQGRKKVQKDTTEWIK